MKSVISILLLTLATLAGSASFAAAQIPGKLPDKPVLFENADIYPVSGPMIEKGQILIDKGKIVAIGKSVNAPADATRVDCTGKRIYPGLFESNSQLGLTETESVRATRDASEIGTNNANVRVEVAVNPESDLIPTTRSNGVLLAATIPAGGTISGRAAIIQLDGWTWSEMTLQSSVAMRIGWPSMGGGGIGRFGGFGGGGGGGAGAAQDATRRIQAAFDDARAYRAAKLASVTASLPAPPADARWEAMIPVLDGKMPILVQASDVQQIQSAVAFAVHNNVKLIIMGGSDAALCADMLKRHDVPVIIVGTQRNPPRRNSAYDDAYTLPKRLSDLGVKFAIASDRGASQVRNLPYHAGAAAGYGLPVDEALKAITLYPAQIYGVADRVGSLEVGKDATLIVCDGDILETPTIVEQAWIAGKPCDMSDRHKRLWEKYKEKYRRQGIEN